MKTDSQALAVGLAGVEGPGRDATGAGLDAIAAAMADADIARASVEYHGWREGGSVDVPECVDAVGTAVAAPAALRAMIVAWVKAVLPKGWTADAGSEGTATIDPGASPRARFDHAWNVESATAAPFTVLGETAAARLRRWRGRGEGVAVDDRLDPLCAALRALGIAVVRIDYCGYGDEGYVEDVQVEPESIALPDALRQQVEDW